MKDFNDCFFVSEIFLSHFKVDKWAKNYLYKKDYRITQMVSDVLDMEFLNFFGKTITECFENKELFLRSKIYNPEQNNICLLQVWKNAKCRKIFLKKVQGAKFKKAIQTKEIKIQEQIKEQVSEKLIQKKIEKLKSKEVIWQFVASRFQKDWMSLGDPLKK